MRHEVIANSRVAHFDGIVLTLVEHFFARTLASFDDGLCHIVTLCLALAAIKLGHLSLTMQSEIENAGAS